MAKKISRRSFILGGLGIMEAAGLGGFGFVHTAAFGRPPRGTRLAAASAGKPYELLTPRIGEAVRIGGAKAGDFQPRWKEMA